MNAFLDLADRQIAAPVKARHRAAESRAMRAAERKAIIIKRDRLCDEWQRWHEERRDALLAGPHAAAAQALLDFLETMTLSDGAALIAQIERGPWRGADADTRFEILSLIDACIVSLRERGGLPPFDDALPGEPLNVFLVVREALS